MNLKNIIYGYIIVKILDSLSSSDNRLPDVGTEEQAREAFLEVVKMFPDPAQGYAIGMIESTGGLNLDHDTGEKGPFGILRIAAEDVGMAHEWDVSGDDFIVNARIAIAYLAKLKTYLGVPIDESNIDVYQVGIGNYAAGDRNPAYLRLYRDYYEKYNQQ